MEYERIPVQGRTLRQPSVMFGKDKATCNGSKWNLSRMKFTAANELKNWACLNIHFGKWPRNTTEQCLRNFVDVLKDCGITTKIPKTINVSMSGLNTELDNAFNACQKDGYKLLLVVLPDTSSQIYNRVKQLGDIEYGIQTVCVGHKFHNIEVDSFKNKPKSIPYNANVALKVNIKNGGVNQVCQGPGLGFIKEGETMVIGIDVTHPSPGSGHSATSVAAMVASSDIHLAQWPAEIRINPARQEKVETLRPMLREHLKYWNEKHRKYPEKLLIYRDGVSEGQYEMVLDEELPKLRAACRDVYEEGKLPRITLIIVGKRHHTRFYRTMGNDQIYGGLHGNPICGTVSTFPHMST